MFSARKAPRNMRDNRLNPVFMLDVQRGGMQNMVTGEALTFTRAGVALAFNKEGKLTSFPANMPRVVPGPAPNAGALALMIEQAVTNKCTNTNANPTATTNITTSGDAAGVLSVVSDTAALAAAGLGDVCTSGDVFKMDNSAGTGVFNAIVGGVTGNTNVHSVSVWARAAAVSISLVFAGATRDTNAASGYVRLVGGAITPGAADQLQLQVPAGGVGYFILNQLEEFGHASSPILVAGASANRVVETCSFPLAAADGAAITMLADFQFIGTRTEGASFMFAQWDVGTSNDRHGFFQQSSPLSVRAQTRSGAATQANVSLVTADTARHRAAYAAATNDFSGCVDGGTVITDTSGSMPVGALTTLRIGGDSGGTFRCGTYFYRLAAYLGAASDSNLQLLTAT